MAGRRWFAIRVLVVLLVAGGAVVVISKPELVCPREIQSFGQLPAPEPVVRNGESMRIGELGSFFLGSGEPLGADYEMEGGAGVVEQVESAFVWTDRHCGRETLGYRFIVIRGVGGGIADISADGWSLTVYILAA
ncbi:hypothetical protein ACWIGI_12665 [Nocardia sp. NPDC055321]